MNEFEKNKENMNGEQDFESKNESVNEEQNVEMQKELTNNAEFTARKEEDKANDEAVDLNKLEENPIVKSENQEDDSQNTGMSDFDKADAIAREYEKMASDAEEERLAAQKQIHVQQTMAAAATAEEPSGKRSKERPSAGSPKWKGFFSLLAAGVVGSALTFVAVPHTNLLDGQYEKLEQQVEELSSKVGNSSSSSNNITAQTTSAQTSDSSTSIADMVESSSKAIVGIVNVQQQTTSQFSQSTSTDVESGSGSGIIFKKDDKYAYIATNNHVIEGANSLEISLYNGDKTKGKLIGADALTDLAVVRIDAKYATDVINFGDSTTLRPGDQVWAIGNPLGLDLSRTVTQGIVSAVDRSITVNTSAGDWEFNVIQTDAAINPGNSGGALINSAGEVVGINSLKISEDGVEGLGFAIPSNDLLPIVNEIIENGEVERPYIGVGLASLEEVPQMYLQDLPDSVTKGVMVTNIDSNSAAAKAGLEVQDVIVSINGTELEGSSDLRKYLYTKVDIGDKVKMVVYHDGSKKTVELTLTSNSSSTN
ncbi:trypsin-like peptidase domain-containing protein [Niallia sp. FSL R7-0271]|uniref:trypsin-like peptidase domain-containing protein n=1 Tax=Niallia sp. FSL R7-0271 TaxID=2921678 RepID=UPI0030F83114